MSFALVLPGFKNLGQFSGFEPQLLLEDEDGEERTEGLMFQSIYLSFCQRGLPALVSSAN